MLVRAGAVPGFGDENGNGEYCVLKYFVLRPTSKPQECGADTEPCAARMRRHIGGARFMGLGT